MEDNLPVVQLVPKRQEVVEKPKSLSKNKNLAQEILQNTQDGKELVERLLALARGMVPKSRPSEQLKAIEILLDRAYGKAPAFLDVSADLQVTNRSLDNFSDEELRKLVDIRRAILDAEP